MDIHPLRQREYEEYLALWSQVFGDKREEIEAFLQVFGPEQTGWVLVEDGVLAAALTCFSMGSLAGPGAAAESETPADPGAAAESETSAAPRAIAGKPAWVSYAICTHPSQRGKGLGSKLTAHVRDWVIGQGGLSFLCPAEPSLVDFYRPLGYAPAALARRQAGSCVLSAVTTASPLGVPAASPEVAKAPPISPATIKEISAATYQAARERCLAAVPHIALSERALAYVSLWAMEGAGLLEIDGGKAICACEKEGNHLEIQELLGQGDPARIAAALGCQTYGLTMPAAQAGSLSPASPAVQADSLSPAAPGAFVQAMAAGLPTGSEPPAFWFGFPFA